MIISLLVYAVVVGVLIVGAARAVETLAGARGAARRFVWLGAMAAMVALPAWRTVATVSTSDPAALSEIGVPPMAAAPGQSTARDGLVADAVAAMQRSFTALIGGASEAVATRLPARAGGFIATAWLVSSAGLLVLLLVVERRGKRTAESLPERRILGITVRVSDNVGPAVVGLHPSRIVVPEWLLQRDADEQRAALAHEEEHVRARDPWALVVGCMAVALAPLNPALWYALSRLRLAVEMDCDARVLRAGFAARSYGELLISVAEHASACRPAALALSSGPSHLHQRILAMTAPVRRFSPLRLIGAGVLAAAALLAACEAQVPTQAQVAEADAGTASRAATQLGLARGDSDLRYLVDGKSVTAAAAKALLPDSIASINVKRVADRRAEVDITTRPGDVVAIVRPADSKAGDPKQFKGLLVINGVRVNSSRLATLDVHDIFSIDVLKGSAATTKYPAFPEAASGAIEITTRH